MTISEKAAYLKGLMDGLKLDTETNEGKMISAIVDLLGDVTRRLSDVEETTIAISDELDEIEEDLDAIEDFIMDEDDDFEDYEEDEEEGTITIYGDPKSYAAIQKHLEEGGYEDVGGEFTYIPNDQKDVTAEQRETINKMVERLEEFDDVQTVFTNMKPEEVEE